MLDTHYYSAGSLITNRISVIRDAISRQAMTGNVSVTAHNSRRVYAIRTRKGQLQVRFDDGRWYNAERVTITD